MVLDRLEKLEQYDTIAIAILIYAVTVTGADCLEGSGAFAMGDAAAFFLLQFLVQNGQMFQRLVGIAFFPDLKAAASAVAAFKRY